MPNKRQIRPDTVPIDSMHVDANGVGMSSVVKIYLVILFFLQALWVVSSSEQVILRMLQEVINTTIFHPPTSIDHPFYQIPLSPTNIVDNYKYSELQGVCKHVKDEVDRTRIGCCTPNDVRHLYNAMISKDGKMVMFQKPDTASRTSTSSSLQSFNAIASSKPGGSVLPTISSVKQQAKINFNMPIEYRNEHLDISKCTRYFNGTLHVIGRSTVKNVYHARM
jgi:hypothetical protein